MTGPVSAISGAPAAGVDQARNAEREKLRAAAQAFEAVFMRQMIGSMRQASLGDDLLGSNASDQFRDMQDAQMADSMAKTGSFGIAEMLLTQFEGRYR